MARTTNPETGTPYSREALLAAFALVEDGENWKRAIHRCVDERADLDAIREAVVFFTGSVPTFTTLASAANGAKVILVRAVGYYAAVGA